MFLLSSMPVAIVIFIAMSNHENRSCHDAKGKKDNNDTTGSHDLTSHDDTSHDDTCHDDTSHNSRKNRNNILLQNTDPPIHLEGFCPKKSLYMYKHTYIHTCVYTCRYRLIMPNRRCTHEALFIYSFTSPAPPPAGGSLPATGPVCHLSFRCLVLQSNGLHYNNHHCYCCYCFFCPLLFVLLCFFRSSPSAILSSVRIVIAVILTMIGNSTDSVITSHATTDIVSCKEFRIVWLVSLLISSS